jgi:transglutaminase-like putative cysteine protease
MPLVYLFYSTIAGYLGYKRYQRLKDIARQEVYILPQTDDEILDEIIEDEIIEDEIIEDPMPISDYIRPYDMTKIGRAWRAVDPQSYIIPDNEVVQWFERNTILDEIGLYYLNGEVVTPSYYPDFTYENEDHWMNADYYLSHNLTGDCEDFAIAIASILEAKGIPNMVVAISDRKTYGHAYLQYYYNGKYYTADTTNPRYQPRMSNSKDSFQKVWMFNKHNSYMTYNENWFDMYY